MRPRIYSRIARIFTFQAGSLIFLSSCSRALSVGGIVCLVLSVIAIFVVLYRTHRNISRQRDREQAILKESESRFRQLFENMEEGFSIQEIITDENGDPVDFRFLEANAAYGRHTGMNPAACIGKTIRQLLPDADQQQIERYGRVALTGEPMTFEYHSKTFNRYLHVRAFCPRKGRFATIFEDITERKRAGDELEQVSARLSLAVRAGGVGVWDFDIVKNVLFWDDQMFSLYHLDKNNFGGTFESWRNCIHPTDAERWNIEFLMALRGEKEFDTEFRVFRSDGSVRNIRALAILQCDQAGNKVRMIGTNWEITHQKQREEALLIARQEAEAASKAKSLFLAGMSHEIRTPLNSIIGFSQLMDHDKLLTESQREYNSSILRSGEHLLALVNDILEVSKMEAGRLELNPTNVDLYALFSDIQLILRKMAQSKHLQFQFDIAGDLPRYVIVDDSKLRRIFVNLIGNAIKFTEKGGVAVRTHVEIVTTDVSRLIAEVEDTGPGIAEKELSRIFNVFEQSSAGINMGSGTGLGLTLSRELAVLMGGNVSVTSEAGRGSLFRFDVLINTACTGPGDGDDTRRVIGIREGDATYRILIVDDNEENLEMVSQLLKLVGYETCETDNGTDAISIVKSWRPHLVLMDLRMPVMDGYEAARRIRLTNPGNQIPIVAITATPIELGEENFFAVGFDGTIRKPFHKNDLFGTIGKLLGVTYAYDDQEASYDACEPSDTDGRLEADIAELPYELAMQMQQAAEVADIDRLAMLNKRVEVVNPWLARQLMYLTGKYDYEYLQKILTNGRVPLEK